MKFLLTHSFFWPDTPPYASILKEIGDTLVNHGHDVHVFSTVPSYRPSSKTIVVPCFEIVGGLRIRRIKVFATKKRNPLIKFVNALLYCTGLFLAVLRTKPDVVTASTFPPVWAGLLACLASKLVNAKFIYHVQDIHPELSRFSGDWLGRGLIFRILLMLDCHTLRCSDVVLTLSADMAETLRARGLNKTHIIVIKNPPLRPIEKSVGPPANLIKQNGKVRLIFAGNLGRFQNLQLLAEGIAYCFDDHPELELFFLGEGALLPELKARWNNHPQVLFAPFLPFSQAKFLIEDSDIGLVSLCRNIYKVASPSKIETYSNLGLKILALVEPQSQLAMNLERSGTGVVPTANTPNAISIALKRLISMPSPAHSPQRISSSSYSWNTIINELNNNST